MGLNELEALKRLSEERVVLKPEFAVADEVWDGVRSWETVLRPSGDLARSVHNVCGKCGQSIAVAWNATGKFVYSDEQFQGLKLAHLIQAHGWTRENCGV